MQRSREAPPQLLRNECECLFSDKHFESKKNRGVTDGCEHEVHSRRWCMLHSCFESNPRGIEAS